jgi:HK97 family phage portal protein
MPGFVARIFRPLVRAIEGEPRPGPHYLPISGGWLPPNTSLNWWQAGQDLTGFTPSSIVARCVSLYAETAASLPGVHWRQTDRGGRARVTSSALSRILRHPNEYQSSSDFVLNLVHSLYSEGNAFALALRNDRFEIDELHLMNARVSAPVVAQDGSVFYYLSGNSVIDRMLGGAQLLVPQHDVLHIRLHSDRRLPWPLIAETPLAAALSDITISNAFTQQQVNYLMKAARPSAVLSTDLVLDKEQAQQLRDRWNEQGKGLHQGGVPIFESATVGAACSGEGHAIG